MAIEEYNPEQADGKEAKGEQDYEERIKVKLKPGQRMRNVILEDCRTSSNQYGDFIIVLLTDVETNDKLSTIVGLGSAEKGAPVFDGEFKKQFIVQDEETGYYHIKGTFKDVPVWIGKVARKSKSGNTYHDLEWGYESAHKKTSEPEPTNTTQEANPDAESPAQVILADCMRQGMSTVDAAKELVNKAGMDMNDALVSAANFYAANQ